MAKFEIRRAPKDESQYQFRLISSSGEILLTSEYYVNMAGCMNGIESVRINSAERSNFSTKYTDGVYYFFLIASNNQSIGKSETFHNESRMKQVLHEVMEAARFAEIYNAHQ